MSHLNLFSSGSKQSESMKGPPEKRMGKRLGLHLWSPSEIRHKTRSLPHVRVDKGREVPWSEPLWRRGTGTLLENSLKDTSVNSNPRWFWFWTVFTVMPQWLNSPVLVSLSLWVKSLKGHHSFPLNFVAKQLYSPDFWTETASSLCLSQRAGYLPICGFTKLCVAGC